MLTVSQRHRVDPTRTASLRRSYAQNMSRRFLRLATDIRRSVVDQDGFGFQRLRILQPAGPRQFAMPQDAEKVRLFMQWLQEQINLGILEIFEDTPEGQDSVRRAWQNTYVRSAYLKALSHVRQDARKAGIDDVPASVEVLFQRRVHVETAQLMYSTHFEALRGVTQAMAQSIRSTLTQGLIEGLGVEPLARRLTTRVSVSRQRARVIAHTASIRTYAEASLNELARLGVAGVTADVEILTAESGVCKKCKALKGKVFTIDEARGKIPVHDGCRCRWRARIRKPQEQAA